jgi:hypothetical protein
MYQATIQSTTIYPDDFTMLQAFVTFDNGDGNPLTRSYVLPSTATSDDIYAAAQPDLDNLNTTATALTTLNTAIAQSTPSEGFAVSDNFVTPPVTTTNR